MYRHTQVQKSTNIQVYEFTNIQIFKCTEIIICNIPTCLKYTVDGTAVGVTAVINGMEF